MAAWKIRFNGELASAYGVPLGSAGHPSTTGDRLRAVRITEARVEDPEKGRRGVRDGAGTSVLVPRP